MSELPWLLAQGMKVDWSIPIGTIMLVVVQFIVGIFGLMRSFNAIEKSIDQRFSKMELVMNAMKEGDMRDMQGRIARLESGQDEWTKALRERTHEHTNQINVLMLEIDRLKRPGHYQRKADGD